MTQPRTSWLLAGMVTVGTTVLIWIGAACGSDAKGKETAAHLLRRAEYALRRADYREAMRLAELYIKQEPDRCEGHWIKGAAQSRLKHCKEARETLRRAIELAPTEMPPVRELARTYAEPAFAKLQEQLPHPTPMEPDKRLDFKKDVGALQEAANDLSRANEALDLARPKDARNRLDLLRIKAQNLEWKAEACRVLADEHDRAAKAETTPLSPAGRAKERQLSRRARKNADSAMDEAKRILLDVVREDGNRDRAAEALYRLAKHSNDKRALAELRKIVLSTDSPPASTRVQMLIDDILASREKGRACRARLKESAQVLDSLMGKNPDNLFAKLVRAATALGLGQCATAERLCNEILTMDSRHAHARLIGAEAMMQAGNAPGAERELFMLNVRYPFWVDALAAYADAAKAVGKKQLAMSAARKAVKLQEQQEPGKKNTRAHRIVADLRREMGLAEEAPAEAPKVVEPTPGGVATLLRSIRAYRIREGRRPWWD